MSHWRLGDLALAFLTALAVLAAWEGFAINNRPETSGYGGDFAQFYTAGQIVARGEAARLYDQPYFRHFQAWMRDDPLCSLYPPTMGLVMAPLARLSYFSALHAWWAIQAMCLLATAVVFFRKSAFHGETRRPSLLWRVNMLLALAALLPVWIAIGIGHLAPMLLLILAGGLQLHRQGRTVAAGLLLSLLAVKPQLAAGLAVWMLLRRDFRTLAGLAIGGAVQAAVVAAALGPRVWLDYLHALPAIAGVTRAYSYSPLFEQSFAGIASNLLAAIGLTAWQTAAMKVVYAVTAAAAAVALCRLVAAGRPFGTARRAQENGCHGNYEYAGGVLFMIIFPPYFLVYDQTLLAVPLVLLWSSPAWRWGVLLLAVSAVPLANLSFTLGFSVTGMIALATLFSLAREATKVPATANISGRFGPGRPKMAMS